MIPYWEWLFLPLREMFNFITKERLIVSYSENNEKYFFTFNVWKSLILLVFSSLVYFTFLQNLLLQNKIVQLKRTKTSYVMHKASSFYCIAFFSFIVDEWKSDETMIKKKHYCKCYKPLNITLNHLRYVYITLRAYFQPCYINCKCTRGTLKWYCHGCMCVSICVCLCVQVCILVSYWRKRVWVLTSDYTSFDNAQI